MAQLEFKNLNFSYAANGVLVLQDICLSVQEGELVLVTGPSGSGKTTLIRHIKSAITPYGNRSGTVTVNGVDIHAKTGTENRQDADEAVGFVGQNPDDQIVTDRVWHELAFGLENMGLPPEEIRRRSAETAAYFGIAEWYRKETAQLSGGQKQLLNLAAVMAMRPKILVLDEPTAGLDPIAAGHFLDTIVKLNKELGITVLLTEHRTERIYAQADRIVMMDGGRIIYEESPQAAAAYAKDTEVLWLPAAARIYVKAGMKKALGGEAIPLTVRDARRWIKQFAFKKAVDNFSRKEDGTSEQEIAVCLNAVCFRYERYGKNALEDAALTVKKREIFAILGGNGSGKTTLLKVIAGIQKCVSGTVRCAGKIAMVAQNPLAMFTEISVCEELAEVMTDPRNSAVSGMTRTDKLDRINKMLDFMELGAVREQNPYDLSGGQQQKLALAKALLFAPDILLLDEPTKGLDPIFKRKFGELLWELAKQKSVVIVSHDVEFCAEYAHRCGLLFDGKIVSAAQTDVFFAGNSYYTTAAARITEDILPGCVTCKQAAEKIQESRMDCEG